MSGRPPLRMPQHIPRGTGRKWTAKDKLKQALGKHKNKLTIKDVTLTKGPWEKKDE